MKSSKGVGSVGTVIVKGCEPKLLDRVRDAIRTRHYSRRTEDAYVTWIRRLIVHHGKRHPSTMGTAEISAFLTWSLRFGSA